MDALRMSPIKKKILSLEKRLIGMKIQVLVPNFPILLSKILKCMLTRTKNQPLIS